MRQDFFEYIPQFKLLIAGNHKPGLRSADEAIKRRMHLIPFTVKISPDKRDTELGEKLKAVRPGILHWAIDGSAAYRQCGLAPPAAVIDATANYLENEDALGRWLEDQCFVNANQRDTPASLYQSWKACAEAGNCRARSLTEFGDQLEARGFERKKLDGTRYHVGVRVPNEALQGRARDGQGHPLPI